MNSYREVIGPAHKKKEGIHREECATAHLKKTFPRSQWRNQGETVGELVESVSVIIEKKSFEEDSHERNSQNTIPSLRLDEEHITHLPHNEFISRARRRRDIFESKSLGYPVESTLRSPLTHP